MFSQTVEYALRAVICLATHPETPMANAAIAKATKVPSPYLAKVLRGLVKAGIITSQRGKGGGVRLVSPPESLSILDVVNAVEPIARIRTCPLGLANHGVRLCTLHARLDQAMANVEKAFRESTLAELLSEPNGSVPLCDEHRTALTVISKGGSDRP